MMFQNILKQKQFMKFVSFILVVIIPIMGFPLQAAPAAGTVDPSRLAKITKQSGNRLTIDKGWVHGVDKGMTGMLRTTRS